jgi:hypothetical protein
MRQRLPLLLSATALIVSVLGSTSLGQAAGDAVGQTLEKAKASAGLGPGVKPRRGPRGTRPARSPWTGRAGGPCWADRTGGTGGTGGSRRDGSRVRPCV